MEKQVEKPIEENSSDFAVEIAGLKKSFGEQNVLDGVDLHLKKGENLVVMGKSGTGKSVLIKCMVRLLEADEGKILILGKNVPKLDEKELNEVRKHIGFLFQGAALYDSMTVKENLKFPLRDSVKIKDSEKDKLVEEALEAVGLKEAIHKMPAELSGGMKKRIGLARTIILKPDIILYDEPTTGLDPITAREISELISTLQREQKTSSIIITHDIECAHITGNRIVLLKDGKVATEGTFDELAASDDEWVRSFFNMQHTTKNS